MHTTSPESEFTKTAMNKFITLISRTVEAVEDLTPFSGSSLTNITSFISIRKRLLSGGCKA
jgi:hypothetical protein